MKGKYYGAYKYDNTRAQEMIKHSKTFFNVEITEFENGKFQGTIEDDQDTGGTPGVGTIKGEIDGNDIFFIKEMPVAAFLVNGVKKTYNRKHPKIHYTGNITDDKIKGVWKIKLGIILSGLTFLLGANTTGTWSMEKELPYNKEL